MSTFKLSNHKKQTTIKRPFSLHGYSMIKNKKVIVECLPAKANTGIVFVINNQSIKVVPENYCQTKLHTTVLAKGRIKIKTVEHILSAFYGMNIDNVIINIQGDNQLPLLDGSSRLYAEKIYQSGTRYLSQPRQVIQVIKPNVMNFEDSQSLAVFLPDNKLVIQAIISFKNFINVQEQVLVGQAQKYFEQISGARTFFIKHYDYKRWEVLQNKFRILSKDPKASQIIAYDQKKYITKLRYDNEPVRHKILDLLGDFAFLGHQLMGKVIVYKPGHNFSHQIVKQIKKIVN